jgi:hypothetical protein
VHLSHLPCSSLGKDLSPFLHLATSKEITGCEDFNIRNLVVGLLSELNPTIGIKTSLDVLEKKGKLAS